MTKLNGDVILPTATEIAYLNPIRYRGYYFDQESGLYYLKSRYYDPQVRRFLNPDSIIFTPGLIGHNIFAYCNNNPVNMIDSGGRRPMECNGNAHVEPPPLPDNYYAGPVQNSNGGGKYGDGDVPYYGEPGSTSVSPNGKKERVYGKNHKPSRDRHKTNHGNPNKHPYVPHDHDWSPDGNGGWKKGPDYPSTPGPLKPQEEIVPLFPSENIAETAAWGAAIYLGYQIIKWGAAVVFAAPTGGASLGGAALLP